MSRLLLFVFSSIFFIFLSCQKENSNSENHLPKAVITTNSERAEPNQEIVFDAGESSDNEDPLEALEIAWSWTETGSFTPYSFEKTATHSYNEVGVYFPRMVIRDTYPLTDTSEIMVVIVNDLTNQPPAQPYHVSPPNTQDYIHSPVRLQWISPGDPENDSLTFDIWMGESLDNMKIVKSGVSDYLIDDHKKYYNDTIDVTGYKRLYFWKVAAKDPNGNYVFSVPWTFSTEPSQSN